MDRIDYINDSPVTLNPCRQRATAVKVRCIANESSADYHLCYRKLLCGAQVASDRAKVVIGRIKAVPSGILESSKQVLRAGIRTRLINPNRLVDALLIEYLQRFDFDRFAALTGAPELFRVSSPPLCHR